MNRTGNAKLGNMDLVLPVAAATKIMEARIVALGASGYAAEATKAENLIVAGCSQRYVDNTAGAAGAEYVIVRRGAFVFKNDGTIHVTDLLKKCYVSDAQTVTITATGSSAAGKILAVDEDGVTVEML